MTTTTADSAERVGFNLVLSRWGDRPAGQEI